MPLTAKKYQRQTIQLLTQRKILGDTFFFFLNGRNTYIINVTGYETLLAYLLKIKISLVHYMCMQQNWTDSK